MKPGLRCAAVVIGVLALARIALAANVPLSEDEAYYWTWSRHLAWGYVDHPPAVAWLIALAAPWGRASGLVRLPFVLAYALAALALGAAARRLSGSGRAGALAALAFALVPETKVVLGEALPDGPYVLAWSCTVWCAAELGTAPQSRRWTLLLGLSLGAALLSRFFAWALVAGVVASLGRAPQARKSLATALALALALYAPFVLWNATHGWANVAFTFQHRQALGALSPQISALSSERAALYAALIWVVAYAVAWRPRIGLIAWTALPLATALAVLGAFTTVESYWLLGPFASLCVGIGIALDRASTGVRRTLGVAWSLSFVYALATLAFFAVPVSLQAHVLQAWPGARNLLYSGTVLYEPLSHDVAALAPPGSLVLTDRLEIAGELYYHGVDVLMVGYAPQKRAWNDWRVKERGNAGLPREGLFVSYSPAYDDAGLMEHLARYCRALVTGPTLQYEHAGARWGAFHTSRCTRSGAPLDT